MSQAVAGHLEPQGASLRPALELFDRERLATIRTAALTCGRCLDTSGTPVHPLDLLLDREIELVPFSTLLELIIPLLPRLGVR